MPITKQKKAEIVKEVEEISKSPSIVFVSFRGLTVANATELRSNLRKVESLYRVAKKSLIRRAFSSGGVAGEMPELPGEIGIAYGTDPVAPARIVHEFGKKNEDRVKIAGGIFEGKYMNASEMSVIATIPPREVLYGMFVNVINSPIQGLVIALDAIAKKKAV